LHDIAIAGQKAELTLEMFLQSRNKLVQAYQEIMRMQI
jgi:flagellar hook-basal body complex protein FliE